MYCNPTEDIAIYFIFFSVDPGKKEHFYRSKQPCRQNFHAYTSLSDIFNWYVSLVCFFMTFLWYFSRSSFSYYFIYGVDLIWLHYWHHVPAESFEKWVPIMFIVHHFMWHPHCYKYLWYRILFGSKQTVITYSVSFLWSSPQSYFKFHQD